MSFTSTHAVYSRCTFAACLEFGLIVALFLTSACTEFPKNQSDGGADRFGSDTKDVPTTDIARDTSVAGEGGARDVSASPCGTLENPMSGLVSMPSAGAGSIATYSCNLGYTLTGAADRTCQSDGTWNGTAPTCALKDCGPLTAPTGGTVSAPVTTYGATATYACGAGKGPSGSATRTCGPDGDWNGMEPTCVPANCPALSGPMGGSVIAATLTFGSIATYVCDSGYLLTGMTTRMCKTDGTWSNTAPTCTLRNCGALTAPTNGTINATGANYGATGTYACNAGYMLSGAATVMCKTDGTWSAAAPTCAIKDCGALAMPTNGSVSAAVTMFGSTATYSCATGYVLAGAATRMCAANGMWSGSTPTCVIKDCGPLTTPANGSVSAPVTTFGATATYSCMTGYGPSGSATRTCTATGWDGTAPTCVIANCPALSNPAGGLVSAPALAYGSMATYTCNAGYNLNGVASRMCQANGQWTGAQPTCDPKDCGAPPTPTNGNVSYTTTTYMSSANYSCDSGYTLSGATTRSCQSDGTWSASAPSCSPSDCGTPVGISNGSANYSATTVGASATYSCATNYTIAGGGSGVVSCLATARWSTPTPSCVDICAVAGTAGNANHCCQDSDCGACKVCMVGTCHNQTKGQSDNRCNGGCNQCDGNGGCGTVVTCYPDMDGDGWAGNTSGAGTTSCFSCPPMTAPHRAPRDDCNDNNPDINPGMDFTDQYLGDGNWDANCDGVVDVDPRLFDGCTANCKPTPPYTCQPSGSCGYCAIPFPEMKCELSSNGSCADVATGNTFVVKCR